MRKEVDGTNNALMDTIAEEELENEHEEKKPKIVRIPRPPPFNKRQIVMIVLFMILEAFYSMLTLSLGPISSSVQKVFKLKDEWLFYLEMFPLIAIVVGFYPTFKILNMFGLKNGLSICLFVSVLGAVAQYFTSQYPILFLVGHFIILLGMQSLHTAKGLFVNIFFQEKNVQFESFREAELWS